MYSGPFWDPPVYRLPSKPCSIFMFLSIWFYKNPLFGGPLIVSASCASASAAGLQDIAAIMSGWGAGTTGGQGSNRGRGGDEPQNCEGGREGRESGRRLDSG